MNNISLSLLQNLLFKTSFSAYFCSPCLVGAFYLHTPGASAIFLHNDVLCNGTCPVTGGGGRGGAHNVRGAQTEKIRVFKSDNIRYFEWYCRKVKKRLTCIKRLVFGFDQCSLFQKTCIAFVNFSQTKLVAIILVPWSFLCRSFAWPISDPFDFSSSKTRERGSAEGALSFLRALSLNLL